MLAQTSDSIIYHSHGVWFPGPEFDGTWQLCRARVCLVLMTPEVAAEEKELCASVGHEFFSIHEARTTIISLRETWILQTPHPSNSIVWM
jgi:hypothetical protein